MYDDDALASVARDVIEGLLVPSRNGTFRGLKPARRGTCVVERCAQFIEEACHKCQNADCSRCTIAADLRSAQERINAERDAEIDSLGLSDQDLEGVVVKIAEGLCADHARFGSVLLEQWHAQN
jgi:hypothetical protein